MCAGRGKGGVIIDVLFWQRQELTTVLLSERRHLFLTGHPLVLFITTFTV